MAKIAPEGLITALDNVAGIADDVARLSGAAGWETA